MVQVLRTASALLAAASLVSAQWGSTPSQEPESQWDSSPTQQPQSQWGSSPTQQPQTPQPSNQQPQQPPRGGNSAYAPQQPTQCSAETRRTRREFREYTPESRDQFIQALVCLRRQPSRLATNVGSPSAYDDFVYVHWQAQNQAHNTAVFPPWHSVFLHVFEIALAGCGWNEPLPYWDWSFDSQSPEDSEIWSPRWFGGNGNGRCITTGFLANQQARFPQPHCINRNWRIEASASAPDGDAMIGAQYSQVEMLYLTDVRSFDELRHALEDHPHNNVHAAVGGDLADPRTSTNDPVFFLHHNNIERWWRNWQKEKPDLAHDYSGNRIPGRRNNDATPNDIMTFYGLFPDTPVWQAFDTEGGLNGAWCFNYSLSITPAGSAAPGGSQMARRSIASFKASQATQQQPQYSQPQQPEYSQPQQQPEYSPYGDPKNPNTPSPYDRTDKYNIRAHPRIPDQMLKNMNYDQEDVTRIRKEEDHLYDFIDYLNAIEGFISDCALINKESGYKPCDQETYEKQQLLRKTIVKGAKAILGAFKEVVRYGIQTFLQQIGERYYQGQGQAQTGYRQEYQQPGYEAPQQPAYQQPQPSYEQPSYQQPSHQQPSYQQPSYQQPTYQQPTYQQPTYQAPSNQYSAPQYAPEYEAPEYTTPTPEYAPEYSAPTPTPGYTAPNPVRPSYH
ncbi:hypothetical protein HK097_004896 [Rhizophlyctis rosea]|uniref:Tyrosinase copper-binding domain-containing protein n=1 Tax=Rhizophlyctis rosea TaxID=64517 RepID=A0AAD5X3D7_9FUNG|nr:hypothetical protein HK097_004896 [Rhizophlyctis rosea]